MGLAAPPAGGHATHEELVVEDETADPGECLR